MGAQKERLHVIEGSVPSAVRVPVGCRFSDRCPLADSRCRSMEPELVFYEAGHEAACWKAG